jgi:CDGSH iron-sulfur domain-containing protein 3
MVQDMVMVRSWRQTRQRERTGFMTKPNIAQKSPMVQTAEPGEYWWCACGLSAAQPFCNGAHKGTGLAPLKAQITESKKVAWCACKQTKTPPFCDGSHRTLA